MNEMISVSQPCLRQFARARRGEEPARAAAIGSRSPAASCDHRGNHFGLWRRQRDVRATTTYHVTDLLHHERTADVPGPEIATTVSAWLAELGVDTQLVDELAQAVCAGDWPTVYAISHRLSVDVTVAA
jgi:hypothetical protein